MRTTRSRSALGVLIASAVLVGVTACSSDSDDTADDPGAPVEETAGAPAPTTLGGTEATSAETAPAPTAGTSGDDPSTDPSTAPVAVVPAALQFSAPLVGGGTFDGAAVAGKPTVFWFWAPT